MEIEDIRLEDRFEPRPESLTEKYDRLRDSFDDYKRENNEKVADLHRELKKLKVRVG